MCAKMTQAQLQGLIVQATDPTEDSVDRIDACHKLGRVPDAAAVQVLVVTLKDPDFSVRWAAAEALAQHGSHGIEAVLQALMQQYDQFLYEGAHHVLKQTLGHVPPSIVTPVITALEGVGAAAATPMAAHQALAELKTYQQNLLRK